MSLFLGVEEGPVQACSFEYLDLIGPNQFDCLESGVCQDQFNRASAERPIVRFVAAKTIDEAAVQWIAPVIPRRLQKQVTAGLRA